MRFSLSGFVLASLRNSLTSSVAAKVMKSKNWSRVAARICVSTCEVSACWLVVGTVAVSLKLVAFAGFDWCFEDFLAIFVRLRSFTSNILLS